MFCNRCGAQLQPDYSLCPKCGTPLAGNAPLAIAPVTQSRLERHLRILGILWIVVGVLWIIPSFVLMGLSHAPHLMLGDDMFMRPFMPPMLFSMGAVFLLVATGGILVGWGLMRHEHWARLTAIVIGILALFHPPFGTALGIYTLWVLVPRDAAAEYERLSRA
jgi:hypothetical protein